MIQLVVQVQSQPAFGIPDRVRRLLLLGSGARFFLEYMAQHKFIQGQCL